MVASCGGLPSTRCSSRDRSHGLLDAGRVVRQAKRDELAPELVQVPAGRRLFRELAHRRNRDRVPNELPLDDGRAGGVEAQPARGRAVGSPEGAQVDALPGARLGREDRDEPILRPGERPSDLCDFLELVGKRHRRRMPNYDCRVAETVLQLTFAVAVVVAAVSLAAAAAGRARPQLLAALTLALLAAAAVGWVVFAFRPERDVAVAATGLLAVAIAEAGATLLARAMRRARTADDLLDQARADVRGVIEAEQAANLEELQRWATRARADSISLLAEEERRLAEERRKALVERERAAGAELDDALAAVEQRVDERLRAWSDDVDRAQQGLAGHVTRLEQHQRQLIAEAEARIEAEAAELVSTSDEQRASVLRLREELERSAQAAVAEALGELEAHTSERRRVIEEISDRLRKREQTLAEQIERSEAEAVARIEVAFADVERRQVEKLQRVVAREAERFAEAAAQQFDATLRTAREEAAVRLSREMERAAETFMRQAEGVFAERLSHTGDTGQQRLETRLRQAQASFDRQHEQLLADAERRISDADAELRRVLGTLVAEAESERAVLEARLDELGRRIDDARAGLR